MVNEWQKVNGTLRMGGYESLQKPILGLLSSLIVFLPLKFFA